MEVNRLITIISLTLIALEIIVIIANMLVKIDQVILQ